MTKSKTCWFLTLVLLAGCASEDEKLRQHVADIANARIVKRGGVTPEDTMRMWVKATNDCDRKLKLELVTGRVEEQLLSRMHNEEEEWYSELRCYPMKLTSIRQKEVYKDKSVGISVGLKTKKRGEGWKTNGIFREICLDTDNLWRVCDSG